MHGIPRSPTCEFVDGIFSLLLHLSTCDCVLMGLFSVASEISNGRQLLKSYLCSNHET